MLKVKRIPSMPVFTKNHKEKTRIIHSKKLSDGYFIVNVVFPSKTEPSKRYKSQTLQIRFQIRTSPSES